MITLISIFFIACGLPRYLYLEPPIDIQKPETARKSFIFRHNTANFSENVEGYSIYYKFYSTEIPNSYSSDDNYYGRYDFENETRKTPNEIQNEGFRLLNRVDGATSYPAQKPTIPLNDNQLSSQTEIRIDFSEVLLSGTNAPSVSIGGSLSNYTLYRAVATSETESGYKGFQKEDILLSDIDVPNDLNENFIEINLVLYAATYGKFNLLTEGETYVKYLGFISI